MTQDQLSEKTGIRRTDINAYCKGRKPLGEQNGPKIADALGLPDDYFSRPVHPLPPQVEHLQQRAEQLLREVAELRKQMEADE